MQCIPGKALSLVFNIKLARFATERKKMISFNAANSRPENWDSAWYGGLNFAVCTLEFWEGEKATWKKWKKFTFKLNFYDFAARRRDFRHNDTQDNCN
jgi:hypothetical protein